MKFFPVKKYKLHTKLSKTDVCNKLLEEDRRNELFDLGLYSDSLDDVSFTVAFYRYDHDSFLTGGVDRTNKADYNGRIITKEAHTEIDMEVDLGYEIKAVVGFIIGIPIFIWVLVLFGDMMHQNGFAMTFVVGMICLVVQFVTYLVGILYLQIITSNSKHFFMNLLQAREH